MKRISDYEIAKAAVLVLAELGGHIAPAGYYDDDADLVDEIMKRSGLDNTGIQKFTRRLFRVCNKLCHCGVLYGTMQGTHKEYYGEPTKQREFRFLSPGTSWHLNPPDKVKALYMKQEDQVAFELRHFPGAPKRD